ncbi:hypothetical protein AX16_007175 [Volvariella volvacea WC 439]|nr:hypothetical protein AX16_007175 [Volvariella volvacea WC 439]
MSLSRPFTPDIPPEILSYIFKSYYYLTKSSDKSPIVLGLVCRQWRSVTLETHILWTSVVLQGSGLISTRYVELVNGWLARSRTLPCEINATTMEYSVASAIPDILRTVAPRIQSLVLSLSIEGLEAIMDELVFAVGFPFLHTLKLESLTDPWEFDWPRPLEHPLNLSACPRLEYICLSSQVVQLLSNEDLIRTLPKSVKVLDYCCFSEPDTVLDLLLRCHNLEGLNLTNNFGATQQLPEEIGFQYYHKSLRHFSLWLDSDVLRIQPLFRAIQFPNLVSLSLADIEIPIGVLQCVADASPPLESLKLLRVPITLDELLLFFQRVPTIIELDIQWSRLFNNSLISHLTLSNGYAARYLPKLKRFTIGNDHRSEERVSNRDLMTFIESRWRVQVDGFSRIDYVAIYDKRVLGSELGELPLSMKGEGLDCHLGATVETIYFQNCI